LETANQFKDSSENLRQDVAAFVKSLLVNYSDQVRQNPAAFKETVVGEIWLESWALRPLRFGKMQTGRPGPFALSINVPNSLRSFLQQIFTCARVAFFISLLVRNENHCLTPSSMTHL
jgi:hypothetical protein